MDHLRQRFMLGSDKALQASQCPADWQPLLTAQSDDGLDLAAVGLLSHAQSLREIPRPNHALSAAPLFPPLDLPQLPAKYHPLVKQLLTSHEHLIPQLLGLLTDRGYALPAQFWRKPKPEIRYPAVYQPWLAYSAGREVVTEAITVDNWDDFAPALRLDALKDLRKTDRAALRALLQECLGREKAEVRLPIVALLTEDLEAADEPLLQTLEKDRSAKVRELVEQLLSQLRPLDEERRLEIAQKVRSWLRLENSATNPTIIGQRSRSEVRNQQLWFFRVVDLVLLAELFKMTPRDFALRLDANFRGFSPEEAVFFLENVARQLSEDDRALFYQKILNHLATHKNSYFFHVCLSHSSPFSERMMALFPPEQLEAMLLEKIKQKKKRLNTTFLWQFSQRPLRAGSLTMAELTATPLWHDATHQKGFASHVDSLQALGFLLPHGLAQEALTALEALDLDWGDFQHHHLMLLKLNATLPDITDR